MSPSRASGEGLAADRVENAGGEEGVAERIVGRFPAPVLKNVDKFPEFAQIRVSIGRKRNINGFRTR